ncbi:short-chain dehydrogenase reductase family [Seiridium cupressi]
MRQTYPRRPVKAERGRGKEDIVGSVTDREDGDTAVEVWELDMGSSTSIQRSAERVKRDLDRLDVLVLGARVSLWKWKTAGDVDGAWEMTLQINALNTFLLALNLLPTLQGTSKNFSRGANHDHQMGIITTIAHRKSTFDEIEDLDLFKVLNDKERFKPNDRYAVTKLMEILLVRELVARLDTAGADAPPVTMNLLDPGLCKPTIARELEVSFIFRVAIDLVRLVFERTSESGGRAYVLAASAGPESHGGYLSDGELHDVEL